MSEKDSTQPVVAKERWGTCADLRLNLDEALAGRTWLLLPEGFHDADCGMTYPLPKKREELQKLAIIPIPPGKKDSGSLYLRRAHAAFRRVISVKNSRRVVNLSRERNIDGVQNKIREFRREVKAALTEANIAVQHVHQEAQAAIASLNELFSLGRKGIEGQMQAHLDGKPWKDEVITASAFRECFRLVASAVKGLGLPSDQKRRAQEAIMKEAADAIKATREAISLAPGPSEETEQ